VHVTIRSANKEDSHFLAQILYIASRSHLDESPWCKIFDETKERTLVLLSKITQNSALPWSYFSNFWIAEVDGIPAAAMCGFIPAEAKPLMPVDSELGIAKNEFDYSDDHLSAISQRLHIATLGMPDDLPDIWAIESIAVLPEFQGQGLIDHLFKKLFIIGQEKGFKQVQVLCLIGNDCGQRAFERNGFSVLTQKTNHSFNELFGTPGAKLLVRNL